MKRLLALLLACGMLFSLCACGQNAVPSKAPAASGEAQLLTAQLIPHVPDTACETQGFHFDCAAAATDFALRLLQQTDDSALLSPVSILYALAMTMNGAEGDTLQQMEDTLGLSRDDLNVFLSGYLRSLPETADGAKLHIADSLWLRDEENRLHPNEDFLQTNVDYYDAEIFSAPFDSGTCGDINSWVSGHTDGMIPEVLDAIPEEAVMYLINALCFDAKWQTVYQEHQVSEGIFHGKDGDTSCSFMHSEEFGYLSDAHASGFLKYYRGGSYAFAALLPEEGMAISDYVASLTGESLRRTLVQAQDVPVMASLPQFSSDCTYELSDVLAGMGMPDLFDSNACDLTGLGTSEAGNIFVSRVIHKTHIDVDTEGTRAAAATVVEACDEGCAEWTEMQEVILDRPFVYLLIDTDTMLPLFIGTCLNI